MKFVTSLSLHRGPGARKPFWKPGVQRLVLVFWSLEDGSGSLLVYGIDPDKQHVDFQVTIAQAQQSALITAVIDGARVIGNGANRNPAGGSVQTRVALAEGTCSDGNVVVISDPGPKDTGPKAVSIQLAVTIAGAVAVANAAFAYRKPPARERAVRA